MIKPVHFVAATLVHCRWSCYLDADSYSLMRASLTIILTHNLGFGVKRLTSSRRTLKLGFICLVKYLHPHTIAIRSSVDQAARLKHYKLCRWD